MTQVLSPSDGEIQDFTEHIDVKFKIDNDVFIGVPNIPANDLMAFGKAFDGMSESDVMADPKSFGQLFELVLVEGSAQRFQERMGSKREPISMTQVMKIMPWIMEKYGMRPMEPLPNSSDGSPNLGNGTSSEVSVSLSV